MVGSLERTACMSTSYFFESPPVNETKEEGKSTGSKLPNWISEVVTS